MADERERFAAMAMQGILAHVDCPACEAGGFEKVSQYAVHHADALLAELDAPPATR